MVCDAAKEWGSGTCATVCRQGLRWRRFEQFGDMAQQWGKQPGLVTTSGMHVVAM